jgi:CRP/FNR family cyclic AMP-dependent transcriptional regulator
MRGPVPGAEPIQSCTTRPDRPVDLHRVAARFAESIVEVPAGAWEPPLVPPAHAFAAVVLDGALLRELHLDEVPATQLVLPGQILDPFTRHASVLCGESVTWRALEPTRLAVLATRFLAATQRSALLSVALQREQSAQLHRVARYAAIAQLSRVEDRIVALFCTLAEDHGHVTRHGIGVQVALTHETIGTLIGARRPTVSLALKALGEQGLLSRHPHGWLLSRRATRLADADVTAVAAA